MTCEEFCALLEREGTAAAREGTEHLRHCPDCERELARWREVEEQLAAMGEEPVPADLHTRVMARLREAALEAPPMPLRVLRPTWAAHLLAAVLLLALGGVGVWYLVQRPAGGPAEQVRPVVAAEAPPPALVGKGAAVPVMEPAPRQREERAPEPRRSEALASSADAPVREEQAKTVAKPALRRQAAAAPAPVELASPPQTAGEELERASEKRVAAASEPGRGTERKELAFDETPRAAQLYRPPAGPGPVQVRCQLLDGENFPRATLWLPEHLVPAIATQWEVVVGAGGEVEVVDAAGTPRPEVAGAIAERLPARPAPGRYRLTQAPLPEY